MHFLYKEDISNPGLETQDYFIDFGMMIHVDHLALDLPVLVSSSHALLIHRALQLTLGWEYGLMVNDDCLNDLINMGLAGYRVVVVWYGHQCGAKADSQVVRVHHVLITVLR